MSDNKVPTTQRKSQSIFLVPTSCHYEPEIPRYTSPDEIRKVAKFPPLLLRYPGTKTRVRFQILHKIIGLFCGHRMEYREPFFGNGTILPGLKSACPRLRDVWINDCDPYLVCLWDQVQLCPESLCHLIETMEPSADAFYEIKERFKGKPILFQGLPSSVLAFGKLVIHRTSRSGLGVMSGGPMGGKAQTGQYKVVDRWRPKQLVESIRSYSELFGTLNMRAGGCTKLDFEEVIRDEESEAVIYCDPPYYEPGRVLYENSMTHEDHERLADALLTSPHEWLLSYDDCEPVRKLYKYATIEPLTIRYSAGRACVKTELLITRKKYDFRDITRDWSFPTSR